MPETFKCPSCSAPLDFEGSTMQKCGFCGSNVIVPPEVFRRPTTPNLGELIVTALTGNAQKAAQIQQLIRAGKKIEAIKLYRETFGGSLKEAKDAVDKMERGEGISVSASKRWNTSETHAKISRGVTGFLILLFSVVIILTGITIAAIFLFKSLADSGSGSFVQPVENNAPKNVISTVLKLGGEGSGAGKFNDNRTVAVDGDGRIYSSNYDGGKIQVFEKDGKFAREIFAERASIIKSIAADRSGNLFVANTNGIFVFDGKTGKPLRDLKINRVEELVVMPDGNILALINKDLAIFNANLKKISEFKNISEAANATFGFDAAAVDGNGFIYVIDEQNGEICKFSPDGKFLNRIMTGLRSPNSIAIDGAGRIFLSDTSAIHAFDANGKEILKFRPPDLETAQAFGITFDVDGALYVASRPFVMKYEFVKK